MQDYAIVLLVPNEKKLRALAADIDLDKGNSIKCVINTQTTI